MGVNHRKLASCGSSFNIYSSGISQGRENMCIDLIQFNDNIVNMIDSSQLVQTPKKDPEMTIFQPKTVLTVLSYELSSYL